MSQERAPGADAREALIPEVVRRLLNTGESVEVRYVTRGAEAFATDSRLIILRSGQPASVRYADMAGVTESRRTAPWLILAGAALIALGTTSTLFPVAGAALVLLGMFRGSRRVGILVSGRSEPEVLDGAREVIEPLLQRLTERGVRRFDAKP
jgi:hypothetical protein